VVIYSADIGIGPKGREYSGAEGDVGGILK